MRRALHLRLSALDGEGGLTLIEMLVAAAMSVVVVGATASMMISAVRTQPQISEKAQNVTTARYQLERITREIRNGVKVEAGMATPTTVSFVARMRRASCGGGAPTSSSTSAIKCQVTYRCGPTSCTRTEASEGIFEGPATVALSGIDDPEVFCFVPSTNPDPTVCGPASTTVPTYIGVVLRVPNPSGSGELTISDGASLRSSTLSY